MHGLSFISYLSPKLNNPYKKRTFTSLDSSRDPSCKTGLFGASCYSEERVTSQLGQTLLCAAVKMSYEAKQPYKASWAFDTI